MIRGLLHLPGSSVVEGTIVLKTGSGLDLHGLHRPEGNA